MEGGGTRVFTKQGKLKKVKKPKKEKKRKGVGPQTFVKKQEIEIPKNEIIEVPKPRGRPRKEPAFVPFVFNPPPPKPPRPKKEKTEEEKVEKLGEMLGEKYQPALKYFKEAPDAEQDKILEKTLKARARKGASSVGGDYGSFTPNDLSAAKQRWQKLRLYVKTLAETERYKEQEDLRKKGELKFGQTIETPLTNLLENREQFKPRILSASEAKNLGIKPPKPRRGKSLERAEPKPKPAENPLDLADQPKKRGRPPKEPEQKKTPPPLPPRTKKEEPKKKGPPLPARPPQVSPPLTFPQLDKPAKAKRGRPKKEPEPEPKKTPPPLPPRKRIQKDISVSSEPLAPLKLPQDLQPEIYGTPKKSPRPKLLKIPPTPPEERERRKKEEAEAIKARSPKKPEKPPTPKLLKSPKPKVTAVEAEKTELLQELKAEVSPKLIPKVARVQELDSEDEDEHDAETAALFAKLPKQRPTAEVTQPKVTPTKEERKKAMEERKARAAKAKAAKADTESEEEQDEEDAALFAKIFKKEQRPVAEVVQTKTTPTKEERKAAADARIAEAARKKKEQEGVERRKAKFLADRAKAEAARAEAAAKYAEEQAGVERRKAKFLERVKAHEETQQMGGEDILSKSVRDKEKAQIEKERKRIQKEEAEAAEKKAKADAKAAAKLKKIQEEEAEAKAKEERLAEIERKKAEAKAKEEEAKARAEENAKKAAEFKKKVAAKATTKAYKELQEITEEAKRDYITKLKKEKEEAEKPLTPEEAERADYLLGLKKAGKYGDIQLARAKAKAAEEEAKKQEEAETYRKLEERRQLIRKGAAKTLTSKLKAVNEGQKTRAKLAKTKEERESAFGDLQLKVLQAKAAEAGKEATKEKLKQRIEERQAEVRQSRQSKEPTLKPEPRIKAKANVAEAQRKAQEDRIKWTEKIKEKHEKAQQAKEAEKAERDRLKGVRSQAATAARQRAKDIKLAAAEEERQMQEAAIEAERLRKIELDKLVAEEELKQAEAKRVANEVLEAKLKAEEEGEEEGAEKGGAKVAKPRGRKITKEESEARARRKKSLEDKERQAQARLEAAKEAERKEKERAEREAKRKATPKKFYMLESSSSDEDLPLGALIQKKTGPTKKAFEKTPAEKAEAKRRQREEEEAEYQAYKLEQEALKKAQEKQAQLKALVKARKPATEPSEEELAAKEKYEAEQKAAERLAKQLKKKGGEKTEAEEKAEIEAKAKERELKIKKEEAKFVGINNPEFVFNELQEQLKAAGIDSAAEFRNIPRNLRYKIIGLSIRDKVVGLNTEELDELEKVADEWEKLKTKPKKEIREEVERSRKEDQALREQTKKINKFLKKPIRKNYPQFKPLFDELGITSLDQFEEISPALQNAILRLSAREVLYPETMTKELVDKLEQLAGKVGEELTLLEIEELEREEVKNKELTSSEEEGEEEGSELSSVASQKSSVKSKRQPAAAEDPKEKERNRIKRDVLKIAGIPNSSYNADPDFKQEIDAEIERRLAFSGEVSRKQKRFDEDKAKELGDIYRGRKELEETGSVKSIGAESTESARAPKRKGARQVKQELSRLNALNEAEDFIPLEVSPESPRVRGEGLHGRLPYGRARGMGDLSDGDVESQDGGGSDQEEKLSHYTYIMPSSPILRRGFKHPAMVSPGMSDHLHPNAAANIHAFSGGLLGRGRSRSRSPSPDDMRGMGMSGCGSMKDKMAKMYKKAVPKSLRPAVEELGSEAVDYAVNSKKVKGMRQDAKEKYEKTVPKSLRPAVAELAKDTGEFAKRQSGFGLKKGSEAARKFMAELRARKGKKMKGGVIPSPPSRSPITDPSLL